MARRPLIRSAQGLIAAILLLAPAWALAFGTLDGDRTAWPGNPTYTITAGSRTVPDATDNAAMRAGFATWQAVQGSRITFQEVRAGGDITIGFLAQWPRDFGADAAGVTLTNRRNGVISSAEVSFNDQNFEWATDGNADRTDVQGVATHEIGHAIGLGHSWYRDATMYWTGGDLELRDLAPDDIRGVRYLYGAGGEGLVCDTCVDDADCAGNGICLGLESDRAFCGQPCAGGCPANSACFNLRNGGTSCAPNARVCSDENPGEGEFAEGDYCFGSDQCGNGLLCLPTGDSAMCVRVCGPGIGGCAAGVECVETGDPALPGLCLPGGDQPYGGECNSNLDCESLFCLPLTDELNRCTVECDPARGDADCPSGPCVETGDAQIPAVCLPPGEAAYGDVCTSNIDCESLLCLPLSDEVAV
ncbi:MAG: matrixin family metalloprotease, partial [Myxococcales bacterium]|nr:matrixin family metalloprotease [Myxococcales bacterium]